MPSLEYEDNLRRQQIQPVCGVDEAGRGALAGPVVAAAVILPDQLDSDLLAQINDSKLLRPSLRERVHDALLASEAVCAATAIDAESVDRHGIIGATRAAMRGAVTALSAPPRHVLVDGRPLLDLFDVPATFIVKGDSQSYSIAAASIVAKVTRDRLMAGEAAARYPEYGFAQHKGYGTQRHIASIRRHGHCALHRTTFEPLRTLLAQKVLPI